MIVTIDGPAGAGKTSVARALARRLGFRFLDTGAMYRAVTLAAIRQNVDWNDVTALADLAKDLPLEFDEDRVLLGGEDVSRDIRSTDVTRQVQHVADQPVVRQHLVQMQRRLADGQNVVTEGRDQGTVAFPNAECKVFLTASREERARRRHAELQQRGDTTDVESVLQQQDCRDSRDTSREVGGLVAAEDAQVVITDGMSLEDVVDHLEGMVERQQQRRSHSQTADRSD
jgi:cytidylate kinase